MDDFPPDLWWPDLIAVAGVTRQTAHNWRTGRTRIPGPARALIDLVGYRRILDGPWADWRCDRGILVSPEGWTVTPGQIRALPLLLQLRAAITVSRGKPGYRKPGFTTGFEPEPPPCFARGSV